jgi:hypothetical protein
MYSAKVEIVKWEKGIENLPNGWVLSKLTVRRLPPEGCSGLFESEPDLWGAFAHIDGKAVIGGSIFHGAKSDHYECMFHTDVDFVVGSICTVTWERNFSFFPEPEADSN